MPALTSGPTLQDSVVSPAVGHPQAHFRLSAHPGPASIAAEQLTPNRPEDGPTEWLGLTQVVLHFRELLLVQPLQLLDLNPQPADL